MVSRVGLGLRVQITQVEEEVREGRRWPLRAAIGFGAIAVLGSLLYGASLALVLPKFDLVRGGLWIALSAGGAWIVFGPILHLVTGLHLKVLAYACLFTMAVGELVLTIGAALNLLAFLIWGPQFSGGIGLNVAVVGISNIVMAAVLTEQLRALGVPPTRSLATWMLVLNGVGAGLFFLLYRVLFGGAA
jgi:hypothetical protein